MVLGTGTISGDMRNDVTEPDTVIGSPNEAQRQAEPHFCFRCFSATSRGATTTKQLRLAHPSNALAQHKPIRNLF